MKKRYAHDCSRCVFLGQYAEYDLYFCDKSTGTLLARYGDDGMCQTSPIKNNFTPILNWEAVAFGLAIQKRLIEIVVPGSYVKYEIFGREVKPCK